MENMSTNFVENRCNQIVVYWEYIGIDDYGQPKWNAGIETKSRWNPNIYIHTEKDVAISETYAIVIIDMSIDDYLYLGNLADLTAEQINNPLLVDEAYKIQKFFKPYSINRQKILRRVWLWKKDRDYKSILSVANLTYYISIKLRTLLPANDFNENPIENFETLWDGYSVLKTESSYSKKRERNEMNMFDQINANTSNATHFFFIPYTSLIDTFKNQIENGNLFIEYSNNYYRIIDSENIDEANKVIFLPTMKRGITTKDASKA